MKRSIHDTNEGLSNIPSNNSSDTFKKLKNELNLLFPGNNVVVHPNVIQFSDLSLLDDTICKSFVETLKLHGFHRVIKMPPDFTSVCNNLYASAKVFFSADENFKKNNFPEREVETGYKLSKDKECVHYKKGYSTGLDVSKDFAIKLEAYFAEASRISHIIFDAVVKGLGGDVDMARKILPDTTSATSPSVARVFSYFEAPIHTVTCAPHQDLGLLSIIPANFPGLEVYSICGNCGVGWENTDKAMDQTDIIVLSGETLNEYTNGGLLAGLHRVVSHEKTELMSSLFNFSSPSLPPITTTTTTTTTPKRGRAKKADTKKGANNTTQPQPASAKVGRISIPFLLRAKTDAKLDGGVIGLKPGNKGERTVGQFFEEERRRRAAFVGLY